MRMCLPPADLIFHPNHHNFDYHMSNNKQHLFPLQIEDCTEAYTRFEPPVASNLKQRIQCLELRGKSLIEIGYKQQGESELKIAAEFALAVDKGA